jgi:hypothetical protein
VGDTIEGRSPWGLAVERITALGEEAIVARSASGGCEVFLVLDGRCWRKVTP